MNNFFTKRAFVLGLVAVALLATSPLRNRCLLESLPQQNSSVQVDSECCITCTSPKDICCLGCDDISTPREHDLLMATMEGLTHHILEKKLDHPWLRNRAWEGNSHIGNRPKQATYYYDWVRSITVGNSTVRHVCEIGMNGGHSAIIFLAALSDWNGNVTMFDLFAYKYSRSAHQYIMTLYPNRFDAHIGNSKKLVPQWTATHPDDKCDVFSIDGDHSYEGAKGDILNAAKASKKGGIVILDDMDQERTRRAFDEAVAEGVLADPHCVENVYQRVGYEDRVNESHARELNSAWCTATVQ